jgi:hypothetical protein
MTRTYTSPASITLVAFLATLIAIAPLTSFAQTTRTTNARFCEGLSELETKILSTLDTRIGSAKTKYQTHLDTLTSKKNTAVANLTSKRTEVDAKWDAQIAAMKAKATTEAQKAAIATFEATVESLNAARRTSVNSAVTTFTNGLDGLRGESGAEYEKMVVEHKAAIEAAFNDAEAACTAGTDGTTVSKELRADLNAAREAFKADRQAYAVRGDFEELRKARVAANNAARETFRKGFAEASKTLRTALGQD